jgi:hypothetical protein
VLANAAMTLPAPPSEINTNSVTHIAKLHAVYAVSAAHCVHQGSLVDCGANGVVADDDVHHIKEVADHCVHVQGIDDHQLMNIHLATVGGYLKKTQRRPAIAIYHQYTYIGRGKTIQSAAQLEWFENDVNDRSVKIHGGLQ